MLSMLRLLCAYVILCCATCALIGTTSSSEEQQPPNLTWQKVLTFSTCPATFQLCQTATDTCQCNTQPVLGYDRGCHLV